MGISCLKKGAFYLAIQAQVPAAASWCGRGVGKGIRLAYS